jgi:SSS family solute:Na+ symporter
MIGSPLLTRERIPPLYFLSYTFIPLSSIAFPHMLIFCLTARRMRHFRRTVVLYPLCLLAIWFPCVLLGVAANQAKDVPAIQDKIEARQELAARGGALSAAERDGLRARMAADDVVLRLLDHYAPLWMAGLLGAGIMAAVMASDSQILALSTMFTEDVFAYYGGKARFGEQVQVHTGRIFVVALTVVAYLVALEMPASIFELAVQYGFTGYAALSPLLVAALFWRGSTKWGAFASTACATAGVLGVAVFQWAVQGPRVVWSIGSLEVLSRTPGGTSVLGFMPVVPVTLLSALAMIVVSKWTAKPSGETIERYFPSRQVSEAVR